MTAGDGRLPYKVRAGEWTWRYATSSDERLIREGSSAVPVRGEDDVRRAKEHVHVLDADTDWDKEPYRITSIY